ncbi:MAG TPA: hypothetical protein VK654_07045 [Nitrospirota bacterium]|nr:hypothetical protein [Nitrospirota bacterium]
MKTFRLILVSLAVLTGCSSALITNTGKQNGSSPAALQAPVPISPKPGTVFDRFPRTTEVMWKAVATAAAYAIEVDCFDCCTVGKWCSDTGESAIAASGIKATAFTFEWVGANQGRWRVWAVRPDGQESPKSAWQDFSYTK